MRLFLKTTRIMVNQMIVFIILADFTSTIFPSYAESLGETELTKRTLVYKPRAENLPSIRIDGNSRSLDSNLPTLYALAPGHIGCTISAQPTLYWYQSQPITAQCELVIMGEDKTTPIFITKYETADRAGIMEIKLAEHEIELSKNVQYCWSISIIPDPDRRSKDVIAVGMIERIDPPESIASALITKSQEDLVYILSREGIWYDAVEKISHLIAAQPERSELRILRAELLDQGNLIEVAEYDRNILTSGLSR